MRPACSALFGFSLLLFCLSLAMGCNLGPSSGIGLHLPPGDLAKGQEAFHDIGCDQCHAIAEPDRSMDGEPLDAVIVLGGRVGHIETHGELVTSIINPSHGYPRYYPKKMVFEAGKSKMPNFNETMTVQQLIDLVSFLQSKYDLERGSLFVD